MNAKKYSRKLRNDFLTPVVNKLIDIRLEQRVSQEELNYRLGIADNLVAKWESGHRTPSTFNLHCWANALDAKLMVASNDNQPPSDPQPPLFVANDNRILQAVA